MRPDTKIWLGIHHVGNAKAESEVANVTVKEAAIRIARFLGTQTLHKRIEILIAREQSSVLKTKPGELPIDPDFEAIMAGFDDVNAFEPGGAFYDGGPVDQN